MVDGRGYRHDTVGITGPTKSNVLKAAALLGLSRGALYRRLEKYGVRGD